MSNRHPKAMNMTDDDNLKGAYNRAPIFKGNNYTYWKANMYYTYYQLTKIWRSRVLYISLRLLKTIVVKCGA